jgi:hypothetical protein
MSGLRDEVIREREVVIVVEVVCHGVHAATSSTQEATTARERVTAFLREVETWATLAKREVWCLRQQVELCAPPA